VRRTWSGSTFGRAVILRRLILRTLWRSATRQRPWHGNRESLRRALFTKESIVWWAATTFGPNRARYRALRAGGEFGHRVWTELTTPRAAAILLDAIARDGRWPPSGPTAAG
jgi:hypothetical protein